MANAENRYTKVSRVVSTMLKTADGGVWRLTMHICHNKIIKYTENNSNSPKYGYEGKVIWKLLTNADKGR